MIGQAIKKPQSPQRVTLSGEDLLLPLRVTQEVGMREARTLRKYERAIEYKLENRSKQKISESPAGDSEWGGFVVSKCFDRTN